MANYTTDVAIIGAGPSGLFMVFEAGFMGYKSVVVDALPQIGGQLAALYPEKPIYDIPAHPMILAGELVSRLEHQAAPYQPTYLLGEPVESFEGQAGDFTLKTTSHTLQAKAVVVAGGGGMFSPRKPTQLDTLPLFEASGCVKYAITDKQSLAGQVVALAGGGDSAVDWAVELAALAAHVHVIHRRSDFRAAEETVRQMGALADAGKITLHTPYQLAQLHGDGGRLSSITLEDLDGGRKDITADTLVCCFGLAPQAGPMATWGLGWDKGQIPVDRSTMQTARPGVLCIGDMAAYDGKVALILTGFAEAAVAGKMVQGIINPEKKYKVQYSTSKGLPAIKAGA